jgi:DNA-binding transcriptional LysR family regulator
MMIPTSLALTLQEPLRHAIAELSAVINGGQAFDPASDDRVFTVIASDYVSLLVLKPLLDALPTLAPHVQLRIRPVEGHDEERVLAREADLLLIPNDFIDPTVPVGVEPLFTDQYVIAAGDQYTTADEEITREELSSAAYLSLSYGSLGALADRRLDALGVHVSVQISAQAFMAPFLLPHSQLVTVLPRKLGEILFPQGVRMMPPPVDVGPINESMVWSRYADADLALRWLRGELRTLANTSRIPNEEGASRI